ncbi:MAG: hypothetical protein JXM79_19920 [Sedimentisphaerales bacterium]|nr:hypothetical protein [Sedimentisphaerales bacterium]
MSTNKWVGMIAMMVLVANGPAVWGQRGMGDDEGVVRQAVETEKTTLEGTIKEIVIEKCEQTTGPFGTGIHLLLTTDEEKLYNVHLGPAVLIQDLVGSLETGQSVAVEAFRTEKMPADNFVAITLKWNGKTVRLRDENLRPTWAGGQGRFFDRYGARPELSPWRQGYGRGYGMGYGRGFRTGYGRGMGRGYGRGWSNGMGYGRGRGGRGQGRGPGLGYRQGMCPWNGAPGYSGYYGWR